MKKKNNKMKKHGEIFSKRTVVQILIILHYAYVYCI